MFWKYRNSCDLKCLEDKVNSYSENFIKKLRQNQNMGKILEKCFCLRSFSVSVYLEI